MPKVAPKAAGLGAKSKVRPGAWPIRRSKARPIRRSGAMQRVKSRTKSADMSSVGFATGARTGPKAVVGATG